MPFARPTARVPNLNERFGLAFFFPLAEGRGSGGKARDVTAEGVKSTKRQRCTERDVASTAISGDTKIVSNRVENKEKNDGRAERMGEMPRCNNALEKSKVQSF